MILSDIERPASVLFLLFFAGGSVLMFNLPMASAARQTISGVATRSFTVSGGTGVVSTSAGVGGYVGQPVAFSDGSVSFQPPGETSSTYAPAVYSGQGTVTGFSSTAGTVYHMKGSFSAVDASTGQVLQGSTDTYVGIKGHSGRGGGNY